MAYHFCAQRNQFGIFKSTRLFSISPIFRPVDSRLFFCPTLATNLKFCSFFRAKLLNQFLCFQNFWSDAISVEARLVHDSGTTI